MGQAGIRALAAVVVVGSAVALPATAGAATTGKPYHWISTQPFSTRFAAKVLPAAAAPIFKLSGGSYGSLVVEPDVTKDIPAGTTVGWTIKLPKGVKVAKVTVGGKVLANEGAPQIHMQIGKVRGPALSSTADWSVGPVKAVSPTIEWRVVVDSPFTGRTDLGSPIYVASSVDATLLDSDKPAFTIGPVVSFGGGVLGAFVKASDATSGIAKVVVGSRVCYRVQPGQLRDDVMRAQAPLKFGANCSTPKQGVSVRVSVTDVAGNVTTRLVRMR